MIPCMIPRVFSEKLGKFIEVYIDIIVKTCGLGTQVQP